MADRKTIIKNCKKYLGDLMYGAGNPKKRAVMTVPGMHITSFGILGLMLAGQQQTDTAAWAKRLTQARRSRQTCCSSGKTDGQHILLSMLATTACMRASGVRPIPRTTRGKG